MGTLMMIGVVVNNSILLVEFANRLRADGTDARSAMLAAAKIRLRPILMTSLTLVASMAPLSFQLAPGNEAMMPLARALLGRYRRLDLAHAGVNPVRLHDRAPTDEARDNLTSCYG